MILTSKQILEHDGDLSAATRAAIGRKFWEKACEPFDRYFAKVTSRDSKEGETGHENHDDLPNG